MLVITGSGRFLNKAIQKKQPARWEALRSDGFFTGESAPLLLAATVKTGSDSGPGGRSASVSAARKKRFRLEARGSASLRMS